MKPETIEIIRKKLRDDVEAEKNTLLRCIELSSADGITPGVETKIKEYRAAYRTLEDFEEWADERKDEDGN